MEGGDGRQNGGQARAVTSPPPFANACPQAFVHPRASISYPSAASSHIINGATALSPLVLPVHPTVSDNYRSAM